MSEPWGHKKTIMEHDISLLLLRSCLCITVPATERAQGHECVNPSAVMAPTLEHAGGLRTLTAANCFYSN